MGKKKRNVVVEGNTLRIEGETYVFAPERAPELRELKYGAHITDGRRDKVIVAIDTRAEVEAYAAELGVTLDSEVTDFLASDAMKFEPSVPVDLSEKLMEIDESEPDAFLDMLTVFVSGSKEECERLSNCLLADDNASKFTRLAQVALSTVEGLGQQKGGKLVEALAENSPELIKKMLELKVS